jgi:hypothetical protein
MHGCNAVVGRVPRAGEFDGLALHFNTARAGLMHTRQQTDHGGFARAIITQKAQHLARPQIKTDVLQHVDGAKGFVDAFQAEDCGGHALAPFFFFGA